jgi:hypothetical protein
MGDIADSIINGEMCQYCMCEYPPEPVGYPWSCPNCASEMGETKEPAVKVNCLECGKRVKEIGLPDHMRDVHNL